MTQITDETEENESEVAYTTEEALNQLRFVRPDKTTTKPDVLQQQFRIKAFGCGLLSTRYEWRDVPIVVLKMGD